MIKRSLSQVWNNLDQSIKWNAFRFIFGFRSIPRLHVPDFFQVITFMFKIVDFAHFIVNSQPITQKLKNVLFTHIHDALSFSYFENGIARYFTEKPWIKTSKTPFFDTFDQMADAEAKIEKQLQITKIQTISQIPSEYQNFPI